MDDKYYMISNDEGDTTVSEIDPDEFLKDYQDNTEQSVLKNIPDSDTNYWGGAVLIIKGKIVSLEPIKTLYQLK